jgi:hypothetical protein
MILSVQEAEAGESRESRNLRLRGQHSEISLKKTPTTTTISTTTT